MDKSLNKGMLIKFESRTICVDGYQCDNGDFEFCIADHNELPCDKNLFRWRRRLLSTIETKRDWGFFWNFCDNCTILFIISILFSRVTVTLRAVVSPGRTLRERNHCEQPFDFPSSMRLHVTPTSNVKQRHFLLIRGKIMTCAPGPGSGGVDRKSWSWVVQRHRAPQSGFSTLIFPLKHR